MTAAKHTPGPWVYELDDGACGNRPYVTTVARCCDFVIGLRSDIPGGNYRDGDPSGDPEADARLIAAAPSMYSLLQSAHDFIDAQSDVNRDGDGPNEAMALAASIRELLDKFDGSAT
jgi:hypothetical protein